VEVGVAALIVLAALVIFVGLGVATRPRRAVRRPGVPRPRLAVRLRRRRNRLTTRLRTGWRSGTSGSYGTDGSVDGLSGSSSDNGSSGYDSSSSHDYGGGGGGDSSGGGGGSY
jgi:hypothetical protein